MTEIIRIENLSKKFGDVTVLENVNLDIERGKILWKNIAVSGHTWYDF